MNHAHPKHKALIAVASALLAALALDARADVVTDWNDKAADIVVEAKLGTPPAIRVLAVVQTAVRDAVQAIDERQAAAPATLEERAASLDAAVAAASRATLLKLLPAQQAKIDDAYRAALERIADARGRSTGIAVGEEAAAAVLAQRAGDRPSPAESYRPYTAAGAYVPTAAPAAPQWAQRQPWLMSSAAQFRPGAPPALTSEAWALDYAEVKALGGRTSTQRTAEQTEIARFWEYSLPPIYLGVVRSVAQAPGRTVADNARLYAAVAQAMDDAMIGVFDAKYHYGFWRPVTAIRNGDIDGRPDTERDAGWVSLVEAPLHPEYPSAHSILAGAVATVLQAEIGKGPPPLLSTASPTAKGAVRRWSNLDEFIREVGEARIYSGIHYRASIEVGAAMGRQVGSLAAQKVLPPH
jgi:hypothetical protein